MSLLTPYFYGPVRHLAKVQVSVGETADNKPDKLDIHTNPRMTRYIHMAESQVEVEEEEVDHRFTVPAKPMMLALVLGMVATILLTAFSYAYFSGQNVRLREALERRVPSEDGITIELKDTGLNYFCVDEGADGSFVCTTN